MSVTVTTRPSPWAIGCHKVRAQAEKLLNAPVYLVERVIHPASERRSSSRRAASMDASVRAQLSHMGRRSQHLSMVTVKAVTENEQATIDSSISSERMSTLREQLSAINATVDRQEASVVTRVGDGIAHIFCTPRPPWLASFCSSRAL